MGALTVEARISCGQHDSRKLLHTFESVNLTLYRLLSPAHTQKKTNGRPLCHWQFYFKRKSGYASAIQISSSKWFQWSIKLKFSSWCSSKSQAGATIKDVFDLNGIPKAKESKLALLRKYAKELDWKKTVGVNPNIQGRFVANFVIGVPWVPWANQVNFMDSQRAPQNDHLSIARPFSNSWKLLANHWNLDSIRL